MYKFKTIVGVINQPDEFDRQVQNMLNNKWQLVGNPTISEHRLVAFFTKSSLDLM